MNKIICFDTNILSWGIKQESTPGQEQNIEKAAHLISTCSEDGSIVIVPSIVIAELMSGVDAKIQDNILKGLSGFRIVPFDLQAALLYAKIWTKDARRKAKSLKITRTETKADSMIVATAIAHGAACIYSHDDGLGSFAKGHVEVRELPNVPPKQNKLL